MVFALPIRTISVFNVYVALTVADFTGLQIILGQWSDMITNWRNFCSVESHFWPVQIIIIQIEKKRFTFTCNFLSVSMIVFLQRQNLRFTAGRIWLFFQVWEWRDLCITREWSFWPVKPPFWLDIVRWPVIILSPAFMFYSVLTTSTFIPNFIYFFLSHDNFIIPSIVKGQK